ncbi:hypothetical protein KCU73_g3, partial [Aureobasidium melanogenum]
MTRQQLKRSQDLMTGLPRVCKRAKKSCSRKYLSGAYRSIVLAQSPDTSYPAKDVEIPLSLIDLPSRAALASTQLPQAQLSTEKHLDCPSRSFLTPHPTSQ